MNYVTKRIDAVVAILIGVLILVFPLAIFNFITFVIGILLIVGGLKRLLDKVRTRSKRLVNSLIMIAIGVLFVFFRNFNQDLLGYLVGGLFVYNGFLRLLKYRKVHSKTNKSLAGAGVVAIGLGILILFFPGIVIYFTNTVIALLFIGYGVVRFVLRGNIASKMKMYKSELDDDTFIDVDSE